VVRNRDLVELLCRASEDDSLTHQQHRALRRAGRAALRWSDEASDLLAAGRSLTELRAVGPWIARRLESWIAEPPPDPLAAPPIRAGFLTRTEVATVIERTHRAPPVLGDLQTHTLGSDGKASVRAMAEAAAARGLSYLAITDHSHGLRIANGMDEAALSRQGDEIRALDDELASAGSGFRVLRSVEMNLSPKGDGDLDARFAASLDLVLGAFHSRLRVAEDQTERFLAGLDAPIDVLAHPRGRIFDFRIGLRADWRACSSARCATIRRSRSMPIPIARTSTSRCCGSRAKSVCASRSDPTPMRPISSQRSTTASPRLTSQRSRPSASSTP
jgi:hypothetical protein